MEICFNLKKAYLSIKIIRINVVRELDEHVFMTALYSGQNLEVTAYGSDCLSSLTTHFAGLLVKRANP